MFARHSSRGIFACGQLALAQPAAVLTNQTSTTGMVGFTTNQTARLNRF